MGTTPCFHLFSELSWVSHGTQNFVQSVPWRWSCVRERTFSERSAQPPQHVVGRRCWTETGTCTAGSCGLDDVHYHHHPRISSRRKSWTKLQGRYVSRITLMSMLLWPIVCIAVWSAEQLLVSCWMLVRYAGHVPYVTECMMQRSLNWTRQRTGSQCNCGRPGVTCSRLLGLKIKRAAEFWTRCNGTTVA